MRLLGHFCKGWAAAVLALAALVGLSSCDSVIYNYLDPCEVNYKLRFVYNYNMKWADAFSHEVGSVRLYAFNEQGELVCTLVESGEILAQEGYTMTLPLKPGKYHLMAWCGVDNNSGDEHFVVGKDIEEVTAPEHANCYLQRRREADGSAHSDANLHPLFHGTLDLEIQEHSEGEYVYTMPLVKDTNKFKIVLQHLSGEDVNVDDFDFCITDANGFLAHDNSLIEDETVHYHPWATYSGMAGVEVRAITNVAVAQAEITVPRLMADRSQQMNLTVRNKQTGETVISIPPIDYALLVKSLEYEGRISDQEYLDRQDEYSMVFFLDQSGKWVSSTIIVNSWRIVINNTPLGN